MSTKNDFRAYGIGFEYVDAIPQHYGNALIMMSQACHGYVEGAARLNRHISEFLRDRLDKTRELGHALSAAEHLEEAASLHQAWMRTATDEYLAHSTRFFEIVVDAASDGRSNGAGLPVKVEGEARKTAAK